MCTSSGYGAQGHFVDYKVTFPNIHALGVTVTTVECLNGDPFKSSSGITVYQPNVVSGLSKQFNIKNVFPLIKELSSVGTTTCGRLMSDELFCFLKGPGFTGSGLIPSNYAEAVKTSHIPGFTKFKHYSSFSEGGCAVTESDEFIAGVITHPPPVPMRPNRLWCLL